jgi:predicted nucleic acid-binding protein
MPLGLALLDQRLAGRQNREFVQLRGTVKQCRDPSDDMFLECAARANADLLIAGDKDLLVLGSYKGTRILTPAQYVSSAI